MALLLVLLQKEYIEFLKVKIQTTKKTVVYVVRLTIK